MYGSDGPGGGSGGPGGGSTASSTTASTTASCPFKLPSPPGDIGTLDGSYQEPWGATGSRLRPLEATILGHFLGTKSPQTKHV